MNLIVYHQFSLVDSSIDTQSHHCTEEGAIKSSADDSDMLP